MKHGYYKRTTDYIIVTILYIAYRIAPGSVVWTVDRGLCSYIVR